MDRNAAMLKDNGSPYEFVLSRNCYVSERTPLITSSIPTKPVALIRPTGNALSSDMTRPVGGAASVSFY